MAAGSAAKAAVPSSPAAPSSQSFAPKLQAPQFSSYNPATFAGREVETAALMEALQHGCRIAAIVGMTGIGKTTLAERVVANLMDANETPLPYLRFSLDDRSLTSDFSSSGAALLRILGDEPTLEDQQDPSNLLHHILNRLCHTPCRVQIDSLERLLRGNEQEGWSEFCDPLWLDLLQKFLAMTECPSQLLLTTQDIPSDLDAVASRYPQFWHCEPLQSLNPDEQRVLFQKLGLTPNDTDWELLDRIGAFYDGHPLVLQVIAEELRQPPFRGNIARYWQHYEAEFTASSEASGNRLDRSRLFRRRVRQRVEQSIQSLPEAARQLLCACSVFRRPVPEDFWYAMLPEGDAQTAFDTLLDRNLVVYGSESETLPLVRQHNLIRSVASSLLKANPETWETAERQAAHLWLTEYQPAPDAPNLETVRGYLEAFDHYCEVSDWEGAKKILINDQIGLQLQTWGNFQEMAIFYGRLTKHLKGQDEVACKKALGSAYFFLSNYSLAQFYSQQSLDLAREIDDKQGQWKALNNLGNILLALGKHAEASHYLQQTLALAKEIGDRAGEAKALGNLGNVYESLGRYEQTIDFYQKHLTLAREIGDRQGEATTLGNMGIVHYNLGRYEQSIDLHQQSLAIQREIGNQFGEGNTLGNLGNAYKNLGQYERAIDFQQQSLTLAREIGDRQGESNALGGLGNTYFYLDNYEQAIDFHQQNLTLAREIGDRRGEGSALGNLGNAYNNLGQYERAFDFYQQCLGITSEIGDRQSKSTALCNLGLTYKNLGQYERAIDLYQQSLTLAREISDRAGEGRALGNLGNVYYSLGQYERAIDFHQQCLTIKREIGDRSGEAIALGNMGSAHCSLGDYSRALELQEEKLAIAIEIGSRGREGSALAGRGEALLKLEQHDEALASFQNALTISQEIGERSLEAEILKNLAELHQALGEVEVARQYAQQALALATELGIPLRAECESLLAELEQGADSES